MNTCEVCGIDCTGKTCSGSCRAKLSRRTQDPERTVEAHGIEAHAPSARAARTNPDLINTGPPMTAHQLEKAGLKANHVPIPGDSDYKGYCKLIGDKWYVKGSPEAKQAEAGLMEAVA